MVIGIESFIVISFSYPDIINTYIPYTVWIINSSGELVVQKRCELKECMCVCVCVCVCVCQLTFHEAWPGLWDISSAGTKSLSLSPSLALPLLFCLSHFMCLLFFCQSPTRTLCFCKYR